MRVVGIAWMPGRIQPGIARQPVSTLDVFPTALALTGASPPEGIAIDGRNISPLLFEQKTLPVTPFFYYRGDEIFACRLGKWKAHFRTQTGYGQPQPESHDPPLLFNLPRDPSESSNVAAANPDVIAEIRDAVEKHRALVVPGAPQLK